MSNSGLRTPSCWPKAVPRGCAFKVVDAYEGDIGTLSRTTADRLKSWLEEFDADLILSAISEAAIQNKRTLAYVSAILKRCRETGIKTAAEFETEKASHGEKKPEEPKWKKIY
jgi:DnaD/phage-associated family protein